MAGGEHDPQTETLGHPADLLNRRDQGCYDPDGTPISMNEFMALKRDPARTRVALDHVGETRVSTVWTGLDPSADLYQRPPHIFETAVFNADGHVIVLARYHTREEAIEGHARALLAERQIGWFRIYPEEAE